jgi:two-component system sensor histidine kinase TctE
MEKAVRDVRAIHGRAPLESIQQRPDLPQEAAPLVEQINELILDLAAAHRLNQRFVADAAHQLRTPVATLRIQLERARRETDPERHARALEDAIAALTRMSHLLHQLLTLAQADETRPAGVADLDLIARQELERRLDDALQAGIDLGYAGPGSAVPVRGAEDLLREALANLLDNALRYGARAGHEITVGVVAAARELYVEDEGPGIAPAERQKVCERFYRIPGSPGVGCGLGLSIVAEIARRHGASFLLEGGAGGRGLRARLLFPAA